MKKPPSKRPNPVVGDRFYSDMQLDARPRNVAGYSIARSGLLPGMRANRQEVYLEGSIDPANHRARTDPLSSLPNNFQEGAIGFQYQLRQSQMQESNSVPLVQKARQSYYQEANLLQPPNVPVSDVGKFRVGGGIAT